MTQIVTITKKVTLTKIVTPFVAFRKSHYNEWAQLLVNPNTKRFFWKTRNNKVHLFFHETTITSGLKIIWHFKIYLNDWKLLKDDYSHECVDGQNFCGTELIADWMPNGEQIFKFSRGCRTNAVAPEGSCAEGQLTGMQYKDCVTTCDTDNCNDDLVGFV